MAYNDYRERVFVYGTLKRTKGGMMEAYGERATFIGDAYTLDNHFTMVYSSGVGGFPFVFIPEDNKRFQTHHVLGELWDVTPGVLEALDNYEGVPSLYIRVRVRVYNYKTKRSCLAWMYITDNEYTNAPCNTIRIFDKNNKTIEVWSY